MKNFFAAYLFVGSMFGTGAATSERHIDAQFSQKAAAYVGATLMWPGYVVRLSRELYDRLPTPEAHHE